MSRGSCVRGGMGVPRRTAVNHRRVEQRHRARPRGHGVSRAHRRAHPCRHRQAPAQGRDRPVPVRPLTVARPTDSPPPAPPLHRVASRDDHTTLSDSSRTSAHPREPRTSRAAFARTSPGAPRPRPRLRARASARHQCFLAAGGHGTCSPSVRAAPRAAPRASRRVLRLTERAGSTDWGPADGEEGCRAQCHGACAVPQSSRCQLSDGPTRGIVPHSRAAHGRRSPSRGPPAADSCSSQ